MVNSKKKMNKSTVAIVVLALLLVLSLVLTATGAWFTDTANNNSVGSVTFGKIEIDDSKLPTDSNGVKTYRAADTSKTNVEKAMPGDKIDVTVDVVKTSGSEEFYFTVVLQVKSITLSTANTGKKTEEELKTMVAELNRQLSTANDKLYCTDSALVVKDTTNLSAYSKTATITLTGNSFTNDYQGATIVIGYEVRAIQVANVTVSQAKTALTTGWNNNAPTIDANAG